ncbi:MAG: ankyrin repeat domain-containing protein [Planctomycetaceae bacterium]|nr:ankyrin repeat domain-containing protein [Planctomycetaceae bacterium]
MDRPSAMSLEEALEDAVGRSNLAMVDELLRAGANPNRPGRAWSSAIACAGENDETGAIIQRLVASGADLNLQNDQGATPLHYAVDVAVDGAIQQNRGSFDWTVVGLMLDWGADLTLKDARGRTAADIAAVYGENARASFQEFLQSHVQRFPIIESTEPQ